MTHRRRETCRICDGALLVPVLSLGPTPLANSFLTSPEEYRDEPVFPLDLYFCEDCALVQLLDVIDPTVLFRNYIYVTGTSDTIAAHNVRYARTIVESLGLQPNDLVVEIASNDGSLLKCFQAHGVRTLGIEPALNIAELASAAGIDTIARFFDAAAAREIRAARGPARAIVANNVLAHVDDPRDFLSGCKTLISRDGRVVIEVPYLQELLDRLEYDTIYHEHLSYFSVNALTRLCDAVGLSIVGIELVEVHGGSLRLHLGATEHCGPHAAAVDALAAQERHAGLTSRTRYERFAADVARSRQALVGLLEEVNASGGTVAGYGAPAKGNTLLNYCQIGTRLVPYTVDKNHLKVGTYTPGMHLPVLPVSELSQRRPDYVLILAWNFASEIISQQQRYRENGRFILPLPEPRVL
jgi:hypothetical protein